MPGLAIFPASPARAQNWIIIKRSIMKATLIFDLALIVMAALLISFERFGYSGEFNLFQIEPMSGHLHARDITGLPAEMPTLTQQE